MLLTRRHALQLFARRVPQRCGPQAHGQSNFHTDGRQKAHQQQPASCSKSSDSDWGGDVGTVTTRAGTPHGQWGHGAGSGGIACSLPSSLGRWGPRLGGRTLPQSYRRRCAIQVDTLGIEPRASRMLSDVIPLHHVPMIGRQPLLRLGTHTCRVEPVHALHLRARLLAGRNRFRPHVMRASQT